MPSVTIITHQHPSAGNWRCHYNEGAHLPPKTTYSDTREDAERKMIQYFTSNKYNPKILVFKLSKASQCSQQSQ